jgi:thiol-disulfide isomerase/thioredoxin
MTTNKRQIVIGVIVFAIGIIGGNALFKWLQGHSEGAQVAQKMVTKHRPDFTLPDLEGVMRNIGEWDGKVTIVNFWATWCPPCRKEMPAFIELQQMYGGRGVQFIGIAIDEKDKVQDFVDTFGVNYPTLLGETDAIEVAKDYGNRFGALPYTAIINRHGDISYIQRGELARETAEEEIKKLL